MESFAESSLAGIIWQHLSFFLAGVATSLTPCVYPMIPITVGIFGAQAAASRLRSIAIALAYVLGIALTYASLGIGAAKLGGLAPGGLLASPYFIWPLSLLLLMMALSMQGFFSLRLPPSLQGRLSMVGGPGIKGAFLLGLVGGVLIAPCSAPVLSGLLGWVSVKGNAWLGGSLLFIYAMGIGLPFFVLAAFATSLPKGGPWMDVVKSFLGVVIAVSGLYYLQNVVSPLRKLSSGEPFFAIAMLLLIAVGLLLGRWRGVLPGDKARHKVQKAFGVAIVSVAALGLVNYAFSPRHGLHWLSFEQRAWKLAREEDKPLLVSFSASWCLPCKKLEAEILAVDKVREELNGWILLKIDVSKDSAEDQSQREKYGADSLPYLVIFDREGRRTRVGSDHKAQKDRAEMLKLLREASSS